MPNDERTVSLRDQYDALQAAYLKDVALRERLIISTRRDLRQLEELRNAMQKQQVVPKLQNASVSLNHMPDVVVDNIYEFVYEVDRSDPTILEFLQSIKYLHKNALAWPVFCLNRRLHFRPLAQAAFNAQKSANEQYHKYLNPFECEHFLEDFSIWYHGEKWMTESLSDGAICEKIIGYLDPDTLSAFRCVTLHLDPDKYNRLTDYFP